MGYPVEVRVEKIQTSDCISLGWCEDKNFSPVDVITMTLKSGEIGRLGTRDIRLALLLDGEKIATFGCRRQGRREGMVIDENESRFSFGREVAEFGRDEAVTFVKSCVVYQEREERWRHDNLHFVYYTLERLHEKENISGDAWKKFLKEAYISLFLTAAGPVMDAIKVVKAAGLGVVAGAVAGAAVGSLAGPVGTVVGSVAVGAAAISHPKITEPIDNVLSQFFSQIFK